MKKYLPVLVLVGFLAFVSPAFAINDVTLTTDTIITVGGINLTISRGSPTVDTLTVNGDSFSVLISAGTTLVISSADKRVLTVPSVGSVQVSNSCLSSENVYTISNPSGASQVTVTATVSSDTCSASGNGSVGGTGGVGSIGGGGGGGGGSSVAPIVATITTPTPAATAAPVPTVSPVFTKPLSVGSKNKDVTRLQTLLASDPSLYPEGTVSGYFGVATKKAVERFQLKYNVTTAESKNYGVFGPATRAKIQEVFGNQSQTPAPTPTTPVAPAGAASTPAVSAVFTKPLSVGSKNKDVTRLQTLLASDPSLYPEGTVSGYFGVATKKAVERFQLKYNVTTAESKNYGVFGPATRAKIQEVFGGQATSGTGASPVEMTTSDVQAKINALMEQVKKLQGN